MPSSPFATTGASGNATAVVTPLGTGAGLTAVTADVLAINSVDYLSNQDKIQLRRDWDAEQQIKTQLDAQATALGVSATAYDNAVAALSTNLIAAGAPAGWATSWPDGTTFAVTSIVINLRSWWSSIATNRATLQKALGDKIQANAAYADALARSSYNIIKNGNSEDATPTGYEAAGVSTYAPNAYSGSSYRAVTSVTGIYVDTYVGESPAAPGDQFYVCAMAWALDGGGGAGGGAAVAIAFYDVSGSSLTGAAGNVVSTSGTKNYQKTQVSLTAPANTVKVKFSISSRLMNTGNVALFDCLYATRMLARGMFEGDVFQTSNYTEVAGNPTAGARMDISGTSFKTHKDGLQIGATVFSEYLMSRITQGLDGTTTGGRIFYRGSCDVTSRGGAPDIAKLTLTRRRWDTTNLIGRLELAIQPSSPADNLDAMRFAKIQLFRQSAAGTTATVTAVDTYYLPINDRSYYVYATDSNAGNAGIFTFETRDSGISAGFPAAIVSLYNVYGPSAGNAFYAAAGNADGSALTNNGTSWPAGITGGGTPPGGGGGGGGGGACPAPWVPITLASGLVVDAGDLYDGAQVVGVNDMTMEPAVGIVRKVSMEFELRAPVILTDGRAPEFSLPHRLAVEGKGWVEVRNLQPGDSILGQRPSIVRTIGPAMLAQVVKFEVEGCHTYLSDDLLSHNIKILS